MTPRTISPAENLAKVFDQRAVLIVAYEQHSLKPHPWAAEYQSRIPLVTFGDLW